MRRDPNTPQLPVLQPREAGQSAYRGPPRRPCTACTSVPLQHHLQEILASLAHRPPADRFIPHPRKEKRPLLRSDSVTHCTSHAQAGRLSWLHTGTYTSEGGSERVETMDTEHGLAAASFAEQGMKKRLPPRLILECFFPSSHRNFSSFLSPASSSSPSTSPLP